ncbi:unnamed protein product [Psylliodes chrysocephalus]|uniref:C2H2-type domain-containing protein n=1 Tax=Psylliodes chrysocephalus TaxID=3402493 RepID=A0A9P0D1T6_9CUCU|nr:unnamed protein product [Psylliodes chrysocephala]
MENIDSYLHKKFKKQVNVDAKIQNDKENKNVSYTEQNAEKIEKKENHNQVDHHLYEIERFDNKDSVPNQSTNSSSFTVNANFVKSSISVGNQQPSNSYISYVVSKQFDHQPVSFDTKFKPQTNYLDSTSSILDTVYPTQNYKYTEETYVPYTQQDEYSSRTEDIPGVKHEEIQPTPDKNTNGKYVCHYCNLVCSKPSVLQKHIRAHTNERPYPCESCGFSFKTKSNLYKHCRSRTHANRLMGSKTQEATSEIDTLKTPTYSPNYITSKEEQQKPYKPRFHTTKVFDNISTENTEEEPFSQNNPTSEFVTHQINEIINRNNLVVNSNNQFLQKEVPQLEFRYNKEPVYERPTDEPLNLTNKNRKRSLSEVSEPVIQKSLIKELLLKNLSSSDMQCPYCKMIFQTVTELDVHKYRSCKGKPSGAKYTRSSSVNVASILTHNKNAFDNIPQLQNTVFPLNSPGPFLGKTRLIDSDKTKSFSFDSGHLPLISPGEPSPSPNYLLSPIPFEKDKKSKIKLFGGEVKVHSSGETKSFKIDGKDDKFEQESNYVDYGSKLSENRVVKTSLHSGGTVLTNNTNYKQEIKTPQEVMMISPNLDIVNYNKSRFTFEKPPEMSTERVQDIMVQSSEILKSPKLYPDESSPLYKNIMDFSQKAIKMLTPNIRPPIFPASTKPSFNNVNRENKGELKIVNPKPKLTETNYLESKQPNLYNPLNLYVNGKVVRHVPGMPGPVAPETSEYSSNIVAVTKPSPQPTTPLAPLIIDRPRSNTKMNDNQIERAADRVLFLQPEKVPERPIKSPNNVIQNEKNNKITNNFLQPEKISERLSKSPKLDNADLGSKNIVNKIGDQKINDVKSTEEIKKFARPNSLALKPTMASLKQHHGLTPTMFNQILISPDTPRVAKKYAEHFLHGNYFSYLGLKSSTRPVYCTLNKTQPFYVPFFKKLSMYSEWRQQDTKQDKLYASQYDSRQKNQRYTVAGKTSADLIIHSSYKFIISETSSNSEKEDEPQKSNAILGGYESNDDYIYVRGRGRGRYVCDQCGIRCKKPSMLKKHIRTHSNDRPYTCSHCNFSFKTKGNLTKHMKSKAHSKNSTNSNGSSSSSAQQSAQSSESDTDDSGMDSSDESTRQQEHEAAYGLLSLSQKPSQTSEVDKTQLHTCPSETFMTTEEIAHFSKSNYAKNKILNEPNSTRNSFNSTDLEKVNNAFAVTETSESQNIRIYLGMGSISRPLTYPYTSILSVEKEALPSPKGFEVESRIPENVSVSPEVKSIKQFHVIQKYASQPKISPKISENSVRETVPRKTEYNYSTADNVILNNVKNIVTNPNRPLPTLKINDVVVTNDNVSDIRKRKFPVSEPLSKNKLQRNDDVIDLSMTNNQEKIVNGLAEDRILNNCMPLESLKDDSLRLTESKKKVDNFRPSEPQENIDCMPVETQKNVANEIFNTLHKVPSQRFEMNEEQEEHLVYKPTESTNNNGTVIILRALPSEEQVNINYHDINNEESIKGGPYDNSAMETLADIATKQVKLEKNTLAKSVASEFLKLATKNENMDGCRDSVNFGPVNKDVNEIMGKSEGNKSCTICSKSFNKPSQLRLHMNIHYLERPFRCDSCSVSFRTKGHLQKHERSASHHNKLSSSPALSSSEPRPFKCSDCSIAFRIHGHLAKHLRSKMHIQKLECLAKIPFGLYAELERSNSLLTEINTCDGDQCLESLKTLAKKVFVNDPNKLNQLEPRENISAD